MNTLQSNATLLNPEVLLRLLLYKDSSQQSTTQLAPDCWIDFDTAFGPQFQVGTQHKVSVLNADRKSSPYSVVVAKSPILGQIPHPEQEQVMVPTATLYLLPI
ncbi:hypothetical protein GO755_34980 [Spirosoma sp. HMF4905]|uniref:Uncharacterized protein n=1 Tax=Spirosoma arboris TaxID=2682092 RepID=A0A7K1SNA7_9BACT|nr:hypothetical protein [Spirosoma arboris]MVM35279.1 hypothetical protein [Spirosoma arboris]